MPDVNLSISQEVVRPIIESKVKAAIISELGKSNELIESVIEIAMNEKVDSEGKKSRYSSSGDKTFLEFICSRSVQTAAKEALDEYLKEHKEALKQGIKKVMAKNLNKLSVAFTNQMIEQAKAQYGGFNVELKIEERKNRY